MKTSEIVELAKRKLTTTNELRLHEMVLTKGNYLVRLNEYNQGIFLKRHEIRVR